jgi:chromosome transmission fidelity protein 18
VWAWQGPPQALFLQFTNRCLLKWLKLWDLVVFGRERPARKPRPGVETTRVGKEATAPGKWKSHEQALEEMLEAELDPSQRPRQKVNPPGLSEPRALPSG